MDIAGRMRVTVCQLPDDRAAFESAWKSLCEHVASVASDLVLLPELPFARWFATRPDFDEAVWRETVREHEAWRKRIPELGAAHVLGSEPGAAGGRRVNRGFAHYRGGAWELPHVKRYLPDEEGFWEAHWYEAGNGVFEPSTIGEAKVGFQICTDLWTFAESRKLGRAGADIIAAPRATPFSSRERWLVAGQAAAISAGAFCLSSNRYGAGDDGVRFAGLGWIIDPDGEVLARTTDSSPFMTCDIDLGQSRAAKATYPRYVR
jgi:N-carbamoylputrescine amidase